MNKIQSKPILFTGSKSGIKNCIQWGTSYCRSAKQQI